MKRIRKRTYFPNDLYFEKIDSADKAYFLGLLVADGNITGNRIMINLQEEDKIILEKFKKYIDFNGKIRFVDKKKYHHNSQNQFAIQFLSPIMVKSLSKLGVVPAKSHKTYFPDIPEHLYSHFIRGVFDGDGCIFINKKDSSFSIVGNNLLITQIQKVLIKNCNISLRKLSHNPKHPENIVYLAYSGNKQLIRIRDWLYKDCEDLYLPRKKEKFDKIEIHVGSKKPKTTTFCNICGVKEHCKKLCKKHYNQFYKKVRKLNE